MLYVVGKILYCLRVLQKVSLIVVKLAEDNSKVLLVSISENKTCA